MMMMLLLLLSMLLASHGLSPMPPARLASLGVARITFCLSSIFYYKNLRPSQIRGERFSLMMRYLRLIFTPFYHASISCECFASDSHHYF